tara:strand:+ start:162 stop:662 length:501 start_codon:yes stop_codon:yes gene_type:complete
MEEEKVVYTEAAYQSWHNSLNISTTTLLKLLEDKKSANVLGLEEYKSTQREIFDLDYILSGEEGSFTDAEYEEMYKAYVKSHPLNQKSAELGNPPPPGRVASTLELENLYRFATGRCSNHPSDVERWELICKNRETAVTVTLAIRELLHLRERMAHLQKAFNGDVD